MDNLIVIGAGIAGATIANLEANKGKKVLVIEKRDHLGGNCYDCYDHGILVHKYGPHIFHTNNKEVYNYLSKFTKWNDYQHEVVGNIYGTYVPIPFNFNSLDLVYKDKAKYLKKKLLNSYQKRVSISELRESDDLDIKKLADYVYENIFYKYTLKQWNSEPKNIDPEVLKRVPVLLSYDNRYFQDTYQGLPIDGYTKLFEKLLCHENISVILNTDAKKKIKIVDNKIFYNEELFSGQLVYTGAVDEFFDYKLGKLDYRSLKFISEFKSCDSYQPKAVVNYNVSEEYTRITEYKKMTLQKTEGTVIVKEYPLEYNYQTTIPYYPIKNSKNEVLYKNYLKLANNLPSFYLLGRLAEYQYLNIDKVVEHAFDLSKRLEERK